MENNKVYAIVGEKEITDVNVNEFLQSIGPQNAMQFQGEEGNKRIVNELINHELMYLDAVDSNLESDDGFKAELEKMKANLLKQYSIQSLLSGASVSDGEVAAYYEQNAEMFQDAEKVRASHILVEEEEKAKEILANIESGSAFETQAKEHSTCPSKERSGDLGEFEKGQMVPEFEEAAFNMEEGNIEGPVKTQFGYHIIKLIEKKPAGKKSLEQVASQIKSQLLGLKQQEIYLEKVETLKDKYTVEVK